MSEFFPYIHVNQNDKRMSNHKPTKQQIADYWAIMVDQQPEDVKQVLTDLITGELSFDDFITNTVYDVVDSMM